MNQENEVNKDESFYKSINSLYQQYQEEKTSDDKRDRQQELILKIWNKVPSWQQYPDDVVATVQKCMGPDSKFDSSKGTFSQYLLSSISYNINQLIKKEESQDNNEIELEKQNKKNGETFFLLDTASTSPDYEQKLTDIQIILTADVLREELQTIQEALLLEKENQTCKASLMTLEILYKLKKDAVQLITDKIYYLAAEFDFIDKELWERYFFDLDNLPDQDELAKKLKILPNTASQMFKRFKERLHKFCDKRNEINKITEV